MMHQRRVFSVLAGSISCLQGRSGRGGYEVSSLGRAQVS